MYKLTPTSFLLYLTFFFSQTHCVVCGYSKGHDGKIINKGSDTFLIPLPTASSASSSLPSSNIITSRAVDSSKKSVTKEKEKDRKLDTLLSKRKDTAHDDYEEEDLNDVVNENDDNDEDDDENVEDSLAYSKYVRARMNESEKACKVPNLGGEKQFTKIPTMASKQGT